MRRSCDEAGFATPQFLLAVALSMVLLAMLANVLVQQYAVAAVQAALDEGVRAGTVVGAGGGHCAARARAAVAGLLGGAYGEQVELSCDRTAERTTAQARVRFAGWAPGVPDLVRDLRAEAVSEP